jgi:hypothetical protein
MKLRTVRSHDNEYGRNYHKRVNDEYDVEDERAAKRLIRDGYVEEVPDEPKKPAAKPAATKPTETK